MCWEVGVIDAWYGRNHVAYFPKTSANTAVIPFIVYGSALQLIADSKKKQNEISTWSMVMIDVYAQLGVPSSACR